MTRNEFFEALANGAKWDVGVSIARTNPLPLDANSVFESVEALDAYVKTNVLAYPGQIVSVIGETELSAYHITSVGENGVYAKLAASSASGDVAGDIAALQGQVSDILTNIESVDGRLDTLEGGVDVEGSVDKKIADAIGAIDYSGLEAAGEAAKVQAALDAYKTSNDTAVKAADDKAVAAQGEIDALELKVGEVADNKTIVQMIADAQIAATYDDTELANRVTANEGAITKLNANVETEGSVDYKIAQAVAAIMENPDDTMNSINELVTWVNDHAEDALELSNKVSANETAIANVKTLVGTDSVATQITNAINEALKVEDADRYALASELTDAVLRIVELEKVDHSHDNKDLLDTYTQTEADLADAVAKMHEHENKTLLDQITELKVAAWDGAEQNAKDYADGLKSELETEIGKKVDKVDGSRLITTSEAEKLEKLVLGDDGSVSVSGTIAAGNVDGLADWITARAGTLAGLSENNLSGTLLEKLNGIAAGAQVNVIESVDETQFAIDEDKNLTLLDIAMGKVTGLEDVLAGKVDKVEGMSLSHNDFTDTLLSKLEGIEAGAQVNYVKSVSDEFVVSDEGKLSVSAINVNNLVQTDGEYLIMNGGSAVV